MASQHILITGASSGIGKALALRLAGPEITLSLLGRNSERLAMTCSECEAKGASVASAQIDVRQCDVLEAWIQSRDGEQPINMVIAAAGVGGSLALAGESGERPQQATELMMVNVVGVASTVSTLTGAMVERGQGQIVILGSIQSLIGLPQAPLYSASKSALRIYADGLRRLLKKSGVHVILVESGFVDTPMSRSLGMSRPWLWTPEEAADRIVKDIGRGLRYSVFPWPLRLIVGLGRVTPAFVLDWASALHLKAESLSKRGGE